VIKKNTDL